jgi:hypothetical protein
MNRIATGCRQLVDFTRFLVDPVNRDQEAQTENRVIAGGNASYQLPTRVFGIGTDGLTGMQLLAREAGCLQHSQPPRERSRVLVHRSLAGRTRSRDRRRSHPSTRTSLGTTDCFEMVLTVGTQSVIRTNCRAVWPLPRPSPTRIRFRSLLDQQSRGFCEERSLLLQAVVLQSQPRQLLALRIRKSTIVLSGRALGLLGPTSNRPRRDAVLSAELVRPSSRAR